jgi:hypothetical protein
VCRTRSIQEHNLVGIEAMNFTPAYFVCIIQERLKPSFRTFDIKRKDSLCWYKLVFVDIEGEIYGGC